MKKAAVKKTKNARAKAGAAKTAAINKARTEASVTTGRKAEVIAMLKKGATTEQICKATGMLPHSARALISGIAKTEKVSTTKASRNEPTIYWIIK